MKIRGDTFNKRKKKICKKEFSANDKEYHKVRDQCHYIGKYKGAAHYIWNLRYRTPREIPLVFHNGFTYDYYFIIKELAKEFQGQFECLEENTYKIKFIDNFRFM